MSLREVAAIGMGQTKFGKFRDRTFLDLAREAVVEALRDAGVSSRSIEVAYCSRFYRDITTAQAVLGTLGISGIEMGNLENACAGGSSAVRALWKDIAAGYCDMGLVFGVESMSTVHKSGEMIVASACDMDAQLGGSVPATFALIARRLMETHGATIADFAQISVKARRAGALNPKAQYRDEITLEGVLASRMVAAPLTLLQCCPNTDGAAALVMCSLHHARRYTTRPIRFRASALQSGNYSFAQQDLTSYEVGRRTARLAYEMAGVEPSDLDVVELHDAFAPEELVHYEDLGLCARGQAPVLLRSGDTSLGGRIPVNPSGGLLSLGHPLGASGVRNVCEIVQQLRGQAGARQVKGARVGLAQMLGGSTAGLEAGACGIHILSL